jgi:hypothetical protein
MKLTPFILVIIPFHLALADIYDCNGVLTNKPCDAGKLMVTEKPYQTPDPQMLEERKRQVWLQNLETARLKAKSDFDLSINIDLVRDVCKTEPIAVCRDAIEKKEREINELLLNKLSIEEKKKLEEDRPKTVDNSNKTAVTIIDDRDDTLVIGDPFNSLHRRFHTNPFRPDLKTTPLPPTPDDPGIVPLLPTPKSAIPKRNFKGAVPSVR